ncbi:MAG: hypothetical protein QF603_18055 [Alphaproteobacteria bacterium]|nr:hypothetical protein [Rhodospirillaceae bacterium]MDP7230460.1 hypothetical protein [Alphaproteobacteria bacterium]
MSVVRVMVFENPITWNEFMKVFRGSAKPVFKKFKKEKTLNRWSLIQIDDHKGMLVLEFDNKSKLNKYLKIASAVRKDVTDDIGMQSWIYSGPVKASG